MARTVKMPKFGLSMETGTIGTWMKQVGDSVTEGDALLEVETDKITNTVEAPTNGTLKEIYASEGQEVAVGEALCMIDES